MQYANKAFLESTGYGEDYQGRSIGSMLGAAAYSLAKPSIERALGGERTRFDGVINVHGEYRHRQVTYVPDRDAAGRVVGFYGLGYDLTDRVRQQNALLEREKHMRSVFSAMAEGLVIHDKNGRIIDVNPAAADILGLSRDQLLGKTSWDPAWQATREDATPCPGAEHPAMITLRTG